MHGTQVPNDTPGPATLAWMQRVGAEQVNIRYYAVVGVGANGYPKHTDTLRIKRDAQGANTLHYKGSEANAPTPEEQAAILAEAGNLATASSVAKLEAQTKAAAFGGDCILFLDPTGQFCVFIEQRLVDAATGKKCVLPWTYWSDGHWRRQERDDVLPFFGMERVHDAYTIVIHEGAKAARDVQALVDTGGAALGAHPWATWLSQPGIVHIGWPGGANRVRDVDWHWLKQFKNKRLIFICDNDQPGVEAVVVVSSILRCPMQMVRFGAGFKEGFDLGDPFEKETQLWEMKKGRLTYVGPSFEDCLQPATWVTTVLPKEGPGRPPVVLREEFVKEWMFAVKPMTFVNRYTMQRYGKDEFNVLVAPFAEARDIATRLQGWQSAGAEGLAYEPGTATGIISFEGRQVVNMYQPSGIKPVTGDFNVAPFMEFMNWFIPEKLDRDHTLKWSATLIARPAIRMHYSMLMVSETHGVGKNTFAEKIMLPLVGKYNCSCPSAAEAADPKFTSWLIFKRLAVISELYDGESAKTYNRLKTVLTDPNARAHEKYEKPFDVPNWVHVIAMSNALRALKLAFQDRRWFMPGITEAKWPHPKWVEFNEWLALGGLQHICAWAHAYVVQHCVQPGEEAPDSAAKQRAIVAALADGEKLVHDLGIGLKACTAEHVVRLDLLRAPWLADKKAATDRRYANGMYLESPELISSVLRRGCGLHVSKQFSHGGERFRVVANYVVPADVDWEALQAKELTPQAAYALTHPEPPL